MGWCRAVWPHPISFSDRPRPHEPFARDDANSVLDYMDTVLTVISDIIIVLTLPLHCRYLYVMLRVNAKVANLEYAFRASIVNIVVANLLYSLIFLLIQEPAAYGVFPDFFMVPSSDRKANSWWLGKVAIMQSVPLILLGAMIHFLIAVNRVTALVNPTGHKKHSFDKNSEKIFAPRNIFQIWTERRVKRTLFVIWFMMIVECIPLIFPFHGSFYTITSPLGSEGLAMVVIGRLPNLIYQGIAVGIGGLFEIITICLYIFIGFQVRRLKKLSQSHITTTVAAVLVSTGGFIIIILILPHLITSHLTGQPIWSTEMFYAVLKFANAYNNAVAPWVMMAQYR
ncbi:hypothetical protein PRIPAC_91415, partial [Pristionchus pacificus]|uniref:Uncharacterized protein n=1 Tax=Pristionchus pacificus TaxID=54126 RepID=A0A2A6CWF4_PRIPA